MLPVPEELGGGQQDVQVQGSGFTYHEQIFFSCTKEKGPKSWMVVPLKKTPAFSVLLLEGSSNKNLMIQNAY